MLQTRSKSKDCTGSLTCSTSSQDEGLSLFGLKMHGWNINTLVEILRNGGRRLWLKSGKGISGC